MLCVPTVNVEMVNIATPLELRAALPMRGAPSKKVTVPVGVPLPNCLVTVAVNVTGWPKADGLAEERSAVVVGYVLIFSSTPTKLLE